MKLIDAINSFKASPEWERLSYNSKRSYNVQLRKLLPLSDIAVDAIEKPQLAAIMKTLPPASGVVCSRVASVLWGWMMEEGITAFNVVPSLYHKPTGTEPWTNEELALFVERAPEWIGRPVELAALTGQRIGDVLKVRHTDVEDGYLSVVQEKTGTPVVVKLSEKAKRHFSEEKRGFVCVDALGRPLTYHTYRKAFNPIREMLGINKTLHGLRVWHATSLSEEGASSLEVRQRLGHRTLAMAERYTSKVSQKSMAKAIGERWNDHIDRKITRTG